MDAETSQESAENKRLRTGGNENQGNGEASSNSHGTPVNTTTDLNFPLPCMKGTPCLLKVR